MGGYSLVHVQAKADGFGGGLRLPELRCCLARFQIDDKALTTVNGKRQLALGEPQ